MASYEKTPNHIKNVSIYIIGSISQFDKIREVAEKYLADGYNVTYPVINSKLSRAELLYLSFTRIEYADRIIAIQKPDGTFGDFTTAELIYAEKIGKTIIIETTEGENENGND